MASRTLLDVLPKLYQTSYEDFVEKFEGIFSVEADRMVELDLIVEGFTNVLSSIDLKKFSLEEFTKFSASLTGKWKELSFKEYLKQVRNAASVVHVTMPQYYKYSIQQEMAMVLAYVKYFLPDCKTKKSRARAVRLFYPSKKQNDGGDLVIYALLSISDTDNAQGLPGEMKLREKLRSMNPNPKNLEEFTAIEKHLSLIANAFVDNMCGLLSMPYSLLQDEVPLSRNNQFAALDLAGVSDQTEFLQLITQNFDNIMDENVSKLWSLKPIPKSKAQGLTKRKLESDDEEEAVSESDSDDTDHFHPITQNKAKVKVKDKVVTAKANTNTNTNTNTTKNIRKAAKISTAGVSVHCRNSSSSSSSSSSSQQHPDSNSDAVGTPPHVISSVNNIVSPTAVRTTVRLKSSSSSSSSSASTRSASHTDWSAIALKHYYEDNSTSSSDCVTPVPTTTTTHTSL
jgi:hypothetical protein